MTAESIPHDYHHLVAELAMTASAPAIDLWLLGTVARRGVLPPPLRRRLSALIAAHRAAFTARAA